MSLASRVDSPPNYRPKFEVAVEALPGDELEALKAMAGDVRWSNAAIMRALDEEHGIRCNKDTLAAWRSRVTR